MEFRTKQVVKKTNKRAFVAYAGLLITASSLVLVFIPGMGDYVAKVFGVGVAVVVIGAFIAKGNLMNYAMSEEDLVVDLQGIRVGDVYYPMNTVTDMDWNVEAYEGLYVNDGAMVSGSKSDGMTNGLAFKSNGKAVDCGFYLRNKLHVQDLAVLFHEYYLRRIPFVERNRNRRTYLLQHLTPQELIEFKNRYGYN